MITSCNQDLKTVDRDRLNLEYNEHDNKTERKINELQTDKQNIINANNVEDNSIQYNSNNN